MANNGNFIKLERKILNWGWYSDIPTKVLFLHCILKANWKDGVFKNQPCERGQFVTSLSHLSKETGLSIRQTRTALEHLQATGEITSTSYSKYRVVTVNNYDKYQTVNKASDKVSTKNRQAKRQTGDKQPTTIEEYNTTYYKEDKEIKKADEPPNCPLGEERIYFDPDADYYKDR